MVISRTPLATRQARARATMATHAAKGRALISVSDKSGLEDLAKGLVDLGYEVLSTREVPPRPSRRRACP